MQISSISIFNVGSAVIAPLAVFLRYLLKQPLKVASTSQELLDLFEDRCALLEEHATLTSPNDDARAHRPVRAVPIREVGVGGLLIREWGGVKHQVTVLKKGVLFREKRYRSLSEVARVITGSRWSGPLFFGLKTGAKEASGDGGR